MVTVDDIAITLCPDVGHRTLHHLIECFGSAEAVFQAGETALRTKAGLTEHLAAQIPKKTCHRQAEKELKFLEKNGYKAIVSTADDYPALLRECGDHPHVLYLEGDAGVLQQPMLAMVGTREITSYGQVMCDELVKGLAEKYPDLVIVSGLAFGVDVACHRAALKYGLKTVAVMGTPINKIYPGHHTAISREIIARGGAIMTEYHSEINVHKSFFAQRNRIVAGLSEWTVVVESPPKGGSLITADLALGYHRSVLAVPGRANDWNSAGTNMLIRTTRAQMVCSAGDILREMGYDAADDTAPSQAKKEAVKNLSGLQKRVMECFARKDEISEVELAAQCEASFPELYEAMFMLECAGLVKAKFGGNYEKI